ncbi:3831_t:CDS:1, partial [Racocetra fulgida]
TKIAQKLPEDLENQLLNFQRFVIRLRQKNDYPLEMIANIDKTPVYFDMVGAMTVNTK